MASTEITVETTAGSFAAIDYGGSGPDCLLIHGTGHNAMAWRDFAEALSGHCRVVAIDMRGHGRTPETSISSEQYWHDVGPIVATLGMPRPVIIGHSTGAYAAMAHVASGGAAEAIVCVDGFTLDARDQPHTGADWMTTRTMLFDLFRYGWKATQTERDKYIEQCVAVAPQDRFNAGIEPSLLRAMLRRCFVEQDGLWLRKPTIGEMEVVSSPSPGARIAPYREIYDQIDVPMLLLWAEHGLSAGRYDDIAAIAASHPKRTLISIKATHNVLMQRPAELARIVSTYLISGGFGGREGAIS